MAKQKISAQRKYEIGTLFDYKLQDVMLPPTLDPVIYPQMNLNTAKAWFQVLSIIQETTSDDIEAGIVSYTFPAQRRKCAQRTQAAYEDRLYIRQW